MTSVPRLDAYHFYEREFESYDELVDSFEWDVPDRFNVATYVCDRWAGDGRTALRYEAADGTTDAYTYGELRDATNRLANYLEAGGVERGDRVGINAPQRPETVITHLACWKLGAVSVPLSTLFGPDAIAYRLEDAGAVAAVVDESNVDDFRAARDSLSALETTLLVGDVEPDAGERRFWPSIGDRSTAFDVADTAAEDYLVLIYTSGTTGDPKGVRHVHRTILGHLPLFVTTFGNMDLRDGDVYWTPAEWAWIAALFDVVFPAMYYGREAVAYNGGSFDSRTAFRILAEYDVTNFFAPPTALRMMMQVEAPRADVGSLRTIAAGGEALGESIVEWAVDVFDGVAVHEGYGQTEANMLAGDCTALTEFREGMVGPAGPGHEIAIVDPRTAEATVPTGDVGEIAVRYEGNPVCFAGYWNKPDRTDAKVRNGWLLTEDLGWMDEDGYLAFESRKDDVIISAGYRIGPTEIEECLASHESVADAGVIGVPDEERGEVPKAFVKAAAGVDPDEGLRAELRSHVRSRLAQYEYPREIEFLEELPKTSTGKVRRASLEERIE